MQNAILTETHTQEQITTLLNSVKAEKAQLQQQLQTAKDKLQQQLNENVTAKRELEQIKSIISGEGHSRQQLLEHIKTSSSRITELEDTVKKLRDSEYENNKTIKELQTKQLTLLESVRRVDKERDYLQNMLDEKEEALDTCQKQLAEVTTKGTQAISSLEVTQSQHLEALNVAEQEINKLRQKLAQTQSNLESTSTHLQEVTQRETLSIEDVNALAMQNKTITNELQTVTRTLNALQTQLSEKEQTNAVLTQGILTVEGEKNEVLSTLKKIIGREGSIRRAIHTPTTAE